MEDKPMKMFKKFAVMILAAAMILGMAGMASAGEAEGTEIVAGLICLHDENSTYDKNFIVNEELNSVVNELDGFLGSTDMELLND